MQYKYVLVCVRPSSRLPDIIGDITAVKSNVSDESDDPGEKNSVMATIKLDKGLLDDDKEWHEAIEEPSHWASGCQLRKLFVLILVYCQVICPLKLWEHTWKFLAEDILYIKRKEFRFPGLELEDEQLKQYTLVEVEKHLNEHNQSLADYDDMPKPDKSILSELSSLVLRQEMLYDVKKETETHDLLFSALNQDARTVYDAVLKSVDEQLGQLFFVSGAGGTGGLLLNATSGTHIYFDKETNAGEVYFYKLVARDIGLPSAVNGGDDGDDGGLPGGSPVFSFRSKLARAVVTQIRMLMRIQLMLLHRRIGPTHLPRRPRKHVLIEMAANSHVFRFQVLITLFYLQFFASLISLFRLHSVSVPNVCFGQFA